MEYCGEYNLKKHSTLRIGPTNAHVVFIDTVDDISKALKLAKELGLTIYPLGGGSNTVFDDNVASTHIFLIPRIKGVSIIKEGTEKTCVQIFAGEVWDDAVEKTVSLNLSGIETLSGIPGLTGSSPVQNIGAYGSELKDTLETVYAYYLREKKLIEFTNNECKFGYRDSIFKRNPGHYFIYAITLKLSKKPPPIPEYKDLKAFFEEKNITHPTSAKIREAILNIRNNKLPNPKEIPNAGSYFKNPIISKKEADVLKIKFPEMPMFPNERGSVKIFAGWLIDKAGLKGVMQNNFGIHKNHALVLVGNGSGTLEELITCEKNITDKVYSLFGIKLEREPVIVS
ncbi:MAG: UDP-N-acetylmuramate dehydrogenase [bacterium]